MENHQLMAAIQQQVAKKEEQALIEWKPCVTGEEETFTKALQQRPINKSTVDELKQVLKLAMLKVGVRANNLPNDVEKEVLIEHIITNYGNHTPMEIKLAFDMAIAGKLDDLDNRGNPIDLETNCYENFSCLYFSKIMNSYRRWARQTHNQLKKDYPKMIAEQTILSDEDKAEWICEWKSMPEINIELIPLMFYEFLDSKKIINLTKKEKWAYTEKATIVVKTKLMEALPICKTTDALRELQEFERQQANGFEKEFKGRILNRAKRQIVFDYLKDKLNG